ncbi:spore germination protein KC [Desulfofundulus thermosubterraneus DSM 16057]|uniref:Spore germination protein KC n=1 Tax=Desulfofundulus thermosubterraneus DSM 16057 TaxID=1121432 RepID=A0A1M6FKF0_9FIRM|nr:spore germination protein KC [Desulfofundulus thermosubterraneus DSM 16057]
MGKEGNRTRICIFASLKGSGQMSRFRFDCNTKQPEPVPGHCFRLFHRGGQIKVFVFLLLFLPLVLSGCWDHREVEDLGIVLLTAVDAAPEGRVRLEVQVLVPTAVAGGGGITGTGGGGGGGGGRKRYLNLATEGRTVFEAIRRLSMESPRELFFAHNQVILISEKLARERGVAEVMDFFERNRQFRRDTWILVARGDPSDIMEVPVHLEVTPAQNIVGVIKNQELSARFAPTRLGEFAEMLESSGEEPYTAILEAVPNAAFSRVSLHPGGAGPAPFHNIKLTGTAVFRRDRLVGWLNEREARGLLWVRGKVRGGPITFSIPGPRGEQKLAVEILRAGRGGVKLEPFLAGGQPGMRVEINTRVNLTESENLELDLRNPQVISRLEKQLAGAIKQEVMACVTRLQEEYRADALGFGEAVHRKYPRVWRQVEGEWEDVFATMPVTVEVKTVIRRIGLINKPLRPPRMQEAQ